MKIWDYVNPDKTEDEIKENTELDIPLIAAAPIALVAAFIIPVVAPIAPVAALVATLSTRIAIPGLLS